MRKFTYEAKDSSTGKIVKASVQAESERSAAKLLTAQGFAPLDIREEKESRGLMERFTGRITTKDRVVFTRQLATLISAGLPLAQSLRTVVEQTPNPHLRAILQDVIGSVEGGKSLHQAFSKHPEVFDQLFLALVAVGEASGTLDEALQRVARQQEKDAATMTKIKGAMTYPFIVLFVIAGVLGFMLFTVVPQVEKLYKDLNQELPLITSVMVAVSSFLIAYWWAVLLVLIALGYFAVQYFRTPAGKRVADGFKLNVPMFNGMFRRLYIARFTRTGESLLESGVPMLDMLHIGGEAVGNSYIQDAIKRSSDKVKGGKALSVSLQAEDYVPELVPQMIKIGEQSGQVYAMLGKTAKIYEDELDEEIRTISTAIEPVLMVVLAVVAGGMVAAILIPIYNLVNTMNV